MGLEGKRATKARVERAGHGPGPPVGVERVVEERSSAARASAARAGQPVPIGDLPAQVPGLPSRAEALEYVLSFDHFHARTGLVAYAQRHVDRVLETLGLVQSAPGAGILELGASPFMMTLLIQRYLGRRVTTANFFGDYGDSAGFEDQVTLTSALHDERHTFRYEMFNLERDSFPYESSSFDVVLCCEILEHLAADPSHMLGEVNRILRPGGRLLLTTPSAKRLENVLLLLRGHNVFPPYSGHGVYGRHNREYTAWELRELLREHGFEADVVTKDAYRHGLAYRLLVSVGPLRRRRDNLFAVATKRCDAGATYSPWLYEHLERR